MDVRRIIQGQLKTELRMKLKYAAQLERLPTGKLSVQTVKGRKYYTLVKKNKRKYIGVNNPDLVKKLQQRRYLEKMIEAIDHNEKYLKALGENYRPVSPEAVFDSLPETYRNRELLALEGRRLPTLSGETFDVREWKEADYEQSTWHPDYKVHITAKGDAVRSKSEYIVSNMLFERGIPYHYEEVLHLPDGGFLVPDFTIALRDGSGLIYLEHCGMLSDEKYRRDYLRKMERYCLAGFRPWVDVFFTFDNANGSLDTDKIGKMMDVMF